MKFLKRRWISRKRIAAYILYIHGFRVARCRNTSQPFFLLIIKQYHPLSLSNLTKTTATTTYCSSTDPSCLHHSNANAMSYVLLSGDFKEKVMTHETDATQRFSGHRVRICEPPVFQWSRLWRKIEMVQSFFYWDVFSTFTGVALRCHHPHSCKLNSLFWNHFEC